MGKAQLSRRSDVVPNIEPRNGPENSSETTNNKSVRCEAGPPKPWERRPSESPQAYRAFSAFRDQSPAERTAVKAAQSVGISTQLAHRWSGRHSWIERATLFDAYLDELLLEQGIQARLEMHRRHTRIACMMLEKLERRLASLKPNSLSPEDVVKWIKLGVEVERLARGESDESSKVQMAAAVQVSFGQNIPAWLPAAKASPEIDRSQ